MTLQTALRTLCYEKTSVSNEKMARTQSGSFFDFKDYEDLHVSHPNYNVRKRFGGSFLP